jgi:uncharacterized protein (DUF433 family)
MSIDEIAYEYDLTRKEIYAALAYAAKRIGEEAIHAN